MKAIACVCLLTLLGTSLGAVAADREAMKQKMQERITAMDTNGDGAISHDEYMANADKQFKRLDKNGDGQITPDERAGAMEALKQRKQSGQFP